ncbi:DUF1501 domain-containing protein [Pirellulales bacterium]|nr:DUF1501 domain-containing protein [Pirellulales bacterium]
MNHESHIDRRAFVQKSLAATGSALAASRAAAASGAVKVFEPPFPAKADAMVMIWFPGGVAQTDTWDPKQFTPYHKGMTGDQILGTCKSIPTSADGIRLGEGLEGIASVMHRGTILRSLSNQTKFGAIHQKAQYYMMTGYIPPVGLKPPSIGAIVSRTLGRRHPHLPPYIYIGRDIDTSHAEKLFISEYLGPGFYGPKYQPFMIPDAASGMATLNAYAGMSRARLDRRDALLRNLFAQQNVLKDSPKAANYMQTLSDARAMMDSPVKEAFDYRAQESAATLSAYEPQIQSDQLADGSYFHGRRFGHGLLLARRLVERGARYVQVEYEYGPFKGFDMHEDGASRMVEMKRQIDGPVSQLIRDLNDRGMLDRTIVMIATEFGRTIASAPAAGREPLGFAERHTGEELVIGAPKAYGFHGHFSSCNSLVFFGGGFRPGFVYGKTADRHPMAPVENPVPLEDAHATVFKALGIPPDHGYVTESRPFFVTKDGKGQPIDDLLA